MRQEFPITTILPSIGNNDVIFHNYAPCGQKQRDIFYGDLLKIWFPKDNLPLGINYEDLKSTFLKGGYYRYDVPNFDVSILSINSMYFYKKVCDVDIIQG